MKPKATGSSAVLGLFFAALLLSCSGGCGSNSSGGTAAVTAITGAGSTFVNPAMSMWAYIYHEKNPGVTVNYQSVGSGAGIAQYEAGTVDFGATDAPLSADDLKALDGKHLPTVQFPVVAGCVSIAYNLPGVPSGLKLTSDVLANIFLGRITKWNDPQIVALNPDAKLPDLAIAVAHRSDGSGTTFIFTDYLSTVSPSWKAGPGTGKSVNWPVGVGGKGSDGVAGLVKQTPGGIGYVEYAYAVQGKLTYASLKNQAGNYAAPSVEGTTDAAAAATAALGKDIRASIVNGAGNDTYPIAGMTYVILAKHPKDSAKSVAAVAFLKWSLADGQQQSKNLFYAPLPSGVVDLGNQALQSIKAQ